MKILLFSSLLLAGTAFGSPCLPGSLLSYINLGAGGCDVGAVSFSGFTTAPGQNGATLFNPSQVQVTPGGSLYLPTLQFTLGATASAHSLLESFFHVRASGPRLIADAITLNSPRASGDGVDTATESICPGAAFIGNSPIGCPNVASLVTFANASFSQLSDSRSFAPTSFFDIFVDLTADGGLAGSATFSSATVQIAATPEPASILLTLLSLATILIVNRGGKTCFINLFSRLR